MTVVYESIGALSAGSDDSAETLAPSGVVSGDLLICCLYIRGGGSVTAETPSNWNLLAEIAETVGTVFTEWYMYWRIANGTSDDTPTIALSNAPANGWYTRIIRFTGHDSFEPIAGSATAAGSSRSDTAVIPITTVNRNNSIALCVQARGITSNVDVVWPSPWIELANDFSLLNYRSKVVIGYRTHSAGSMSFVTTSGWGTSAQEVPSITAIIQPPLLAVDVRRFVIS